ncbi:DUF2799 domain-containing protein [Pseudoalteromonas luteoviolacea]|uniref:Lipoprotein n=1 Tax=Pseudoalteromonas luteoviolacea H33 TaxID=1365251 RepID=A0A167GVU5_9GAMM|nr:DUF2799 domain-containing protein [Pseudoalteromonas luteoviolacea]KZN56608.1 hypothetical protein N476_00605 [Pseudoalteromonas luteoviolacea H33]KZN75565.1 hypothetical protein N477_17910 [Pseudoalteromonas luteoviolacea H33-S]MBQ4876485.1 DUF2799 domain-containing protein [Pseudoalteromonas luteoviolacea]MBQ4905116.1 DUF2799 domain-containing protein [Pseudoalteromonas luteoviolacea]
MVRITLWSICITLIAGCSSTKYTFDYANCSSEDWQALGHKTAMSGENVRFFDAVKQTCGDTLSPDAQEQFVNGYSSGLFEYCTFETGYQSAIEGNSKTSICPVELYQAYQKGFAHGQRKRTEIEEYMARQKREIYRHKQNQISKKAPKPNMK